MRVSLLAAPLLVVLAACPEDGTTLDAGTNASDAGPIGALEQYCEDLSRWLCESAIACACIVPSGDLLDATECQRSLSDRCVQQMAPAQARIADGSLVVLPDNIRHCIEKSRELTSPCEVTPPSAIAEWCDRIMSSTVELGQPCDDPVCAHGAGVCQQGTCIALPALGEPCDRLCEAGLRCVGSVCSEPLASGAPCGEGAQCPGSERCINGTCRARAPAGSGCSDDVECQAGLVCSGGTCATAGGCAERGLVCASSARCAVPVTRECVPKAASGAGCRADGDCAGGLYCAQGACAALPGSGETCANGLSCAPALGCTGLGTCAALPGDGETCANSPAGPVCGEGFGCMNGTCAALPTDGQECAQPNLCAPQFACDFTSEGSFCTSRKGQGEPCQNDQVCSAGLFCDFAAGACAPWQAAGSACSAGNECGSAGSCIPDGIRDAHCYAMPGQGDACYSECDDGLYCRSTGGAGHCLPELCGAIVGG